jgi:fused signal recognition particle receptor
MLELSSDVTREQRSWLARLKDGLAKTRSRLSGLFGAGAIDPALFEELEAALLASDAGVDATRFLLAGLRERAGRIETAGQLKAELRTMLVELLAPLEQPLDLAGKKPRVIMLAGVNGAGKTTSIGKLARYLQNQGLSVLLAAGDTFRAAAREQLAAWGEKNAVAVVAQSGGDPGAVVFDAVAAARARGIDVVIADTAGRLPTQLHLMEEVKKIGRVLARTEAGAPHEIWLVLDANTGQNALGQVKAFDDALGLTGLILTKLDGTARGGVVCAIALARSTGALARSSAALARSTGTLARSKDPEQRPLPLRFVGIGEGIDDLRPFAAREFVSALLD